jgi:hypothetical protein
LLDILFFPFALLGVEQLRVVPHATASTHFVLPYMPYTHSLAGSLVLSLLAGGATYLLWKPGGTRSKAAAIAVGAAVFSHWLLDLIVHMSDLPLLGNDSPKLGFGLWMHPDATWLLEALLLLGALALYAKTSEPTSPAGKRAMPIFIGTLLVINVGNIFGPPPPGNGIVGLSIAAMVAYLGFAAVAFWVERYRRAAAASGGL